MDSPMFTLIDDEYHIIGGDELTLAEPEPEPKKAKGGSKA